MPRVSRDAWAIQLATDVAARSTCSRLWVGAVATLGGSPCAMGYNGAPRGLSHCDHRYDEGPCLRAVHAEVNLVASAARNGIKLDGATVYVTHSPCLACAGLLINAGISRVVYKEKFRSHDGIMVLTAARVRVEQL